MSTTRFTYQHLVELVDGDDELIVAPRRGRPDRAARRAIVALVDVDRVLVARTLWRDLEVEWPGIEVILRLRDESGRRAAGGSPSSSSSSANASFRRGRCPPRSPAPTRCR